VYDVAAGRGRGRGSLSGTRHSDTFGTILLTSGEEPTTSFTNDGGTRARVVELWGSPFGSTGGDLANVVTNLNTNVLSHYGHAGPLLVQYVCDHRSDWNAWRQAYHAQCQHFEQLARGNAVAHRMASHLALLDFAAEHVHQAIDLPWDYGNLVDNMWEEATAETHEADRAEVALRHFMSWANANRTKFFALGGPYFGMPHDCYGRWDGGFGSDSYEYVGVFPHKLDEVLKDGGFHADAIRRMWRDRDWLKTNADRMTLKVRLTGDKCVAVVAIRRTAIESLEPADAD
jgi:hypothetical protein